MNIFDKSLLEFVSEFADKKISEVELAKTFYQIEKNNNTRDPYWTEKQYLEHLKSSDRIFYSLEKGSLSGFVFYKSIPPELEVTHWSVLEKGCGQGTLLWGLFMSQVASKSHKVILECGEWNHRALKLYESFLFLKVAFRPSYYRSGEGAWIMERNHNS